MQIQQDNFIHKLLSLEKGRAYIPDLRKKRTWYLKKLTDAKLIKYIRRGNTHAFDVLIKRHEPKLKNYLRGRLKDRSLTDDVAQDIWEKIIREIRGTGYHEKGDFKKWLRTIVFHEAMTVNRRRKYNPQMIEYDSRIHDVEDEPCDMDVSDTVVEEAKKIISTFGEKERNILMMHFEKSLSFTEIAKKMKLNRNSIKSSHLRTMEKARIALSKKGYKRDDILSDGISGL